MTSIIIISSATALRDFFPCLRQTNHNPSLLAWLLFQFWLVLSYRVLFTEYVLAYGFENQSDIGGVHGGYFNILDTIPERIGVGLFLADFSLAHHVALVTHENGDHITMVAVPAYAVLYLSISLSQYSTSLKLSLDVTSNTTRMPWAPLS